ncbi:MAG: type VII toxin-antitoxin system MntA family adenylyltransferase antitoxin [Acidobacteriota bacterium]
MKNLEINKEKLETLCQKYNIKLMILHGSYAKGNARSESDIDIGILSQKKFDFDEQIKVVSDFSEVFGDKFDPVFLNGAEPLISYQVAVNGRLLYEAKKGMFHQFRIQAVARYMDSKKFRVMEKLYLKRAIEKM